MNSFTKSLKSIFLISVLFTINTNTNTPKLLLGTLLGSYGIYQLMDDYVLNNPDKNDHKWRSRHEVFLWLSCSNCSSEAFTYVFQACALPAITVLNVLLTGIGTKIILNNIRS